MKLLIFGKTGQVARQLARIAPEARFLGRDEADLMNPAACAAMVAASDADAIVNAAAWTAVDKAEAVEAAATVVNGEAPAEMAQAAAVKGVPFLHVSTDYVFDGAGNLPFAPDHPTAPLGAYGRSKLAGERGVRAAGGTHAILRTSWVVSAHGSNFVKTMLRLSETRETVSIVADQIGGPTPAAAIAAALVDMARQLTDAPAKSGTYHLSGAPDASWAEFAREIFAQAGRATRVEDIPTSAYPTPARRPQNSRLDCSTLCDVFGVGRPDWRLGLADILKELRP